MNYGVILAGGHGKRFWPLSRREKPKQFLKLTSGKTMLEETIERVKPLIPLDNIRIVAGESMSRIILSLADHIESKHLLTEPQPRNTCLAIGLAAVQLAHEDPDAVLVVLSADHLVRPANKLLKILEDGCAIAAKEQTLITIGIAPARPETGYGYIKVGEEYETKYVTPVYRVAAFAEKPKAVVAQEYYYSRKYLWNSGMFIWSARAILEAIRACQTEMGELLDRYSQAIGTRKEEAARRDLYVDAKSISIDYAVLEAATNVLAMKADIVWDDVGSWTSLERYKELDADNNVIMGDSVLLDTYETTLVNDAEGIVAALGVSDLVIVRLKDITLVAHKAKLDQIKDLLAKMEGDEKLDKYL